MIVLPLTNEKQAAEIAIMIIKAADTALYTLKENGKHKYYIY